MVIDMSIRTAIKSVDPDREYNLTHIKREGLFPWAIDVRTIRKAVKRDFWGENLLKAEISGTGKGADYKIKGRNIIKFLEKYGPGYMHMRPRLAYPGDSN